MGRTKFKKGKERSRGKRPLRPTSLGKPRACAIKIYFKELACCKGRHKICRRCQPGPMKPRPQHVWRRIAKCLVTQYTRVSLGKFLCPLELLARPRRDLPLSESFAKSTESPLRARRMAGDHGDVARPFLTTHPIATPTWNSWYDFGSQKLHKLYSHCTIYTM